MPGAAKRKYVGESIKISKSVTKQLNSIMPALKPGYTARDILNAYKCYYPYEWKEIVERQNLYRKKDEFLVKVGKKRRYHPESAEKFFFSLQKVKHVLSKGYRDKHTEIYTEEARLAYKQQFEKKRDAAIIKHKNRINDNRKRLQELDPGFIDVLIYAYHRKGNSINDKLEILNEIEKYECEKTIEFFWKINDSEKNDEIRHLAFKYLQDIGHYVKLRKGFKGKKNSYMTEKGDFVGTPEALTKRLQNSRSVQNKKHYDLFISHSYLDRDKVREIVKIANKVGINCYLDWTADDDFLKRNMVSEYTKEVLKHRMMQSDALLYISSDRSRSSDWVAFELEYYETQVKRPVYMILLDGKDFHDFKIIDTENLKDIKK